ncbi:MAG: HEAT repeat domain-containing protein [Candidatus Hermodarchaeota archaeon]
MSPLPVYYGFFILLYSQRKIKSYAEYKKERSTNKNILQKISSSSKELFSPLCQKILQYGFIIPVFDIQWLRKLFSTQLDPCCSMFFSLLNDFSSYEEDVQKLSSLLSSSFQFGTPPSLFKILESASKHKKHTFLKSLSEKNTELILNDISEFIDDDDEAIRHLVASILSKFSDSSQVALNSILRILRDSDTKLRSVVLVNLCKLNLSDFSLSKILHSMTYLLKDKNPQIRPYATWILYNYRSSITPNIARLISISDLFQQHAFTDKKHQTAGVMAHVLPLVLPNTLYKFVPQILAFYTETKAKNITQVILNVLDGLSEKEVLPYRLDRKIIYDIYSLLKEQGTEKATQTFKRLINNETLIGLSETQK